MISAIFAWSLTLAEIMLAAAMICSTYRLLRGPRAQDRVVGFDSLEEAAEILRKPCPPEMREAGFRQARRSDVSQHIRILLDIWASGSSRAAELAGQAQGLPEPAAA